MLCAVLLCGVAPLEALAAASMEKEEVVYATLNADGSLLEAYVVNILHGGGDIVDYGDYTAVRNMTTGDTLTLEAGKVTGSTEAGQLFYEGMLEETELPWVINIRYALDGEPFEATDLPGRSGAFVLDISTRKNEACTGDFYDRYALQIALSLDSNLFRDIQAEGATIANVGGNKQFTYTVLPGKDKDIHITADVTDFRMDGISINGLELNLGLDFDRTEIEDRVDEMMDGIDTMQNGADDLMEGVADMRTAVHDDLLDAATTLAEGATTLQEGAAALEEGIASMSKMADADTLLSSSLQMMDLLQSMQATLAAVSIDSSDLESLTEATAQLQLGLDAICEGMEAAQSGLGYSQFKAALAVEGLDVDALIRGNAQSIETLTAQAAEAEQALATLPEGKDYAAQRDLLQAQLTQATTLATLLGGNNAALSGLEVYLDQVLLASGDLYTGLGEFRAQYTTYSASIETMTAMVSELLESAAALTEQAGGLVTGEDVDAGQGNPSFSEGYAQLAAGARTLAAGSAELVEGLQALRDGVDSLYNSIGELYDGTIAMSDGTTEMKEKVDTAYADITEKVDDLLDSVSGNDDYVASFTSPMNTSVQSIQFVMRTDALEKATAERAVLEKEEDLTFLEKVKQLFQ
ncbi:hypothetical protein LJC74_08015 [Eubacteriales bacterium OttesenSCG-928-A19]|nr:hypothetical protein [Eubacteriales bacterium OttesenSCG-928-A19]